MASAHPLIDHGEIRKWAEARSGRPACVRRTGGKGDPGMIRLDFPGFGGGQSLAPITWKEWFDSFEKNNLALIVQDQTARGQKSNFNKLVSRESVLEGAPPRRQKRKQAAAGRGGGASKSGARSAQQPGAGRGARKATARSQERRRSAKSTASTRKRRSQTRSAGSRPAAGSRARRRSS